MVDTPRLLNAKQAAELLGISTRKLWELTNRRDVACVRIGRAVRYQYAALAAWIEARTVDSVK